MSLEWKTVELKTIANVIMGQSPKSEFYNENFEGMPFYKETKHLETNIYHLNYTLLQLKKLQRKVVY